MTASVSELLPARIGPPPQDPAAAVLQGTGAPCGPGLTLSEARLRRALADLSLAAQPTGGLARDITALWLKSELFLSVLGAGAGPVSEAELLDLAAMIPAARRRIGPMIAALGMAELRARLDILLQGQGPVEARMARFLASFKRFPHLREGRWLRDLAAEVLHFTDPRTVPLMARWIWDAGTGTGAMRELWQADDIDTVRIDLPDDLATFAALQAEIDGFLRDEGHVRDRIWLADLLLAHVYAGYIKECGAQDRSADAAQGDDPMRHTRRMLGLDGRSRTADLGTPGRGPSG